MSWILPISLATLIPVAYYSPIGLRLLAVRRLRARCARARTLVLTYDDGPSPETTPRLLALLAKRRVKATFFMKGSQVDRHPDLVDLVVSAGHGIGSHSQNHLHAWKSLPTRVLRDVERGYSSLSRWVGQTAPFRPPYGKLNGLTWLRLRLRRVPLGWWTLDGGDTWTPLPQPSRVARAVRASRGGVVLLHDLDRSPEQNQFVLDATAELLDTAEAEGLQVLPLGQLLNWPS